MKMNPEGDVQISDDVIDGLGIKQQFLNIFFGSIISIAKTPPRRPLHIESVDVFGMYDTQHQVILQPLPPEVETVDLPAIVPDTDWTKWENLKPVLIACVPNPGYFVAGGLAGIVSRTSTAPLDRLKVYLIAQTSIAQETVSAAKSGAVLQAIRHAWRPLADATKELWEAGGIRSLYAGG